MFAISGSGLSLRFIKKKEVYMGLQNIHGKPSVGIA